MKRFYLHARPSAAADGHGIELDGKPVRTPGRAPLAVPSQALATAMAAEWDRQGDRIDPRSMPMTGLANAAIDRIAPDPEAFSRGLARYGESDLLCYRADGPGLLVERQSERWDPIIAWASSRYDIAFEVVTGIVHRRQPDSTVDRLAAAVRARNPFELAGLSPLVTVSGSLLVALAVAEQAVPVDQAWAAASLDEEWQAEQWGEDPEAAAALRNRRSEFEAGARFLALLRGEAAAA